MEAQRQRTADAESVPPRGRQWRVTGNEREVDAARALFDARIQEDNGQMDYEVSRDGQRFLTNEGLAVGNSMVKGSSICGAASCCSTPTYTPTSPTVHLN